MTTVRQWRKASAPSEHAEQCALINWAAQFERTWPELECLFAIPNGGDRHWKVGQKLKAEGVRRGVPDLCLPVARQGYHGLYIELKKLVGGSVSADQSIWTERLRHEGYRVEVCHGWVAGSEVIFDYLASKA